MSQGITIKGKTSQDELVEVMVDNQGRILVIPSGGSSGLTDAELRATPVSVTDPDVVTAIENISIPAPVGGATESEQSDQTDILEQIREAINGIALARGTAADLRVTLLGSTAAIGNISSLTNVTTVATLTNIAQVGSLLANSFLQGQANMSAIQSNINNVIVS